MCILLFQFHKGTIKTTFHLSFLSSSKGYFNSIKVRLKLKIVIKVLIYALFQFHKGTIKTQEGSGRWSDFSYFNSIKVRLKPPASPYQYAHTIFQFHKGTIKTINSQLLLPFKVKDFNSIKVRLKLILHILNKSFCLISIP